jgi:drug/metabolite transporter (DMT)-like permease
MPKRRELSNFGGFLTPPIDRRKAAVWMFGSGVGFAIMATLVKHLAGRFSALELVFYRSFFNLLVLAPVLWFQRIDVWPSGRGVLVLRGVWGVLSLLSYFWALSILPLSIAPLLVQLAPIFVVLWATLILKDRPPRSFPLWAAIALGGLFLVLSPAGESWTHVTPMGLAVGVGSAFFLSLAQVTVRSSVGRFRNEQIIFWLVLISTVVAAPAVWSSPQTSTLSRMELFELFGMSIAAGFGQLASTQAFRHADASTASLMGSINAVLPVLVGWIAFGDPFTLLGGIGVLLFIFGIAGITRAQSSGATLPAMR